MPTKQLILKVRNDRTIKPEALRSGILSLVKRPDIDDDSRVDAIARLMQSTPRATMHDADLFIQMLGVLIRPGGESFRDQLFRAKLGSKCYDHQGLDQPVTIEISELEIGWLSVRLKDKHIKISALPLLGGLFLLDLIEQLGLEIDPLVGDEDEKKKDGETKE